MKTTNKLKICFFICLFVNIFLFSNAINASSNIDNELYCQNDIVMDIVSGEILYEKHGKDKIYPASTTKLLTAILVIENLDLNTEITVSKKAVYSTPYESSVMGVKIGEVFTVEQLLYGLMLPSGNDAALVLAEAVSSDINSFVNLMNSKLKELGLYNTHFENPHGFHDPNHYSTCEDMANLFRYCLKNDTFKKIISTKTYTIEKTNITNKKRVFVNTNKLCNKSYPDIYYEYIKGGKTGYTLEANGAFIGYAQKDDKNIIVGCFNGSQDINGYQGRYLDAVKLCDYTFDNFSNNIVAYSNEYNFNVNDYSNHVTNKIKLENDISYLSNDINYCINNYDIYIDKDKLNTLNSNIKDEIDIYSSKDIENEIVGTLTLYSNVNGKIIKNDFNLICYNISKLNYYKVNHNIFWIAILIFILFIIFTKISNNKKKRRKKLKKREYLKTSSKKINDPLNIFNSARYRR